MNSARELTLLQGLIDWVDLGRVHWHVTEENPSAPLSDVQNKTLETIRFLVSGGLFELGDLSGEGGCFAAWETSLDESMKEIYDVYVNHFDDKLTWTVYCWLNLTDKGEQVARPLQKKKEI
jgi:hypothetical protein